MRVLGGVAAVASVIAALIVGAAFTGGASGAGSPTVDVYVSLPLHGSSVAQTRPMTNAIKLALDQRHGRAGAVSVVLHVLDDSTAAAGEWSPTQTFDNADQAAADSRAVLYIGDFNSGASEVSIPILNQAGIAQISPSNTYAGLTVRAPGEAPGQPQKFYPTHHRTFMRLQPPDPVQASALLNAMRTTKCTRLAIAVDGEAYGVGLADETRDQAGRYGIRVVSSTRIDPRASSFAGYAQTLRASGAGCFLFAGIAANGGVPVLDAVAAALPDARLFGGDATCTTSLTSPRSGGIAASAGERFECTSLPMPITAYPGGRTFLSAYRAAFGASDPDPYALYAYEAMELGLDTIAKLGPQATSRSAVVHALLATRHRHSVLGVYSFTATGDTTLRSYGLWGVAGGRLRFLHNAFS